MSVLFTDSGAGTNANPIGGSYVTMTGIGALRRLSNQIANAAGSDTDSGAYINVTTPNDHYCQGTPTVVGGRDGGPMVRCQVATASGVLMTDYNATDVEAYVLVAGSFGSFVDRDAGTYQTTSVVRLQAVGTTYTSKIDAATINNFTNATYSTGKGGLFLYDGTQRWTNIEVGDFTTGYTLALAQGSYALTGQAVGLKAARKLALAQGSYALTGQSVTLTYGVAAKTLAAAQGSYALNGQTVGLTAVRKLVCAQGSYGLTGQTVALKSARKMTLAQGSYALSGQTVGLSYSGAGSTYTLALAQGSYALTGSDAAADYAINISSGSYALSGQTVGLRLGRKTALAQGAYTYTGQSVAFRAARSMVCASGSYALTGRDVGLTQHAPAPRLTCASGQYNLSGNQVGLLYSGNRGEIFHTTPLNWWTKGL